MPMKNIVFIIGLVCVGIHAEAQRDTLQRYPFLYLYDWPETGIYHDSVFCHVDDTPRTFPEYGTMEYATYQHIDVNLKAVGIAIGKCYRYYSYNPGDDSIQIRLSLYDQNMNRLRQTITHEFYIRWTNWYTDTNFRVLTLPGKHAWMQEPLDSSDMALRFAYFDLPIDLSPGDYYLGIAEMDKTAPNYISRPLFDLPFVAEHHDPPYTFRNDTCKYYKNNEWHDAVLEHLLSSIFLIIEPECHTAENIRVTTDSAGCVNVEWDTLKYQRQWVMRLDGPGGTRYDTVDTNAFTYCGINTNAHYELSILTQCYRPGGHNYSSWSAPLTIGNGSAAIDDVSTSNFQFSVFPNPASSDITVKVSGDLESVVTLLDATGRTVIPPTPFHSSFLIPRSSLSPGVYLLRLHTATGVATKKLIVK